MDEKAGTLTPRARHMAEWLCDATDRAQQPMFREASVALLLRELPDHWTAEDVRATSAEIRSIVGPKASRHAWLTAVHWLAGHEERLPSRPRQGLSEAAKLTAQQTLRTILATLTGSPRRDPAPDLDW